MTTTTTELLARNERRLWLAALVVYGGGDTVTTFVGLSTGSVMEVGPVAGPAIGGFGLAGLLGVKLVLFTSFVLLWSRLRTPGRVAIPLALVTVGGLVTIWNLGVILTAP